MSFVSLDNLKVDRNQEHIILFNLTNKELNTTKNICRVIGIKEIIIINSENADSSLEEILKGNISIGNNENIKDKAIIFNNIDSKKINFILESLKKAITKKIYKATITYTSRNWSIKTLIKNLIEEELNLHKSNKIVHE